LPRHGCPALLRRHRHHHPAPVVEVAGCGPAQGSRRRLVCAAEQSASSAFDANKLSELWLARGVISDRSRVSRTNTTTTSSASSVCSAMEWPVAREPSHVWGRANELA